MAAARFDERVIGSPPEGAALEMVTVPTELAPPRTDVGLSVRPVTVGAVMARVGRYAEVVPTLAEMEAVAFDAIPVVVAL